MPHLLFAEQLHLGVFLPGKVEQSRMGLIDRTAKRFAAVGSKPSKDIEEMVAEWDAVHKPIRATYRSASGADERALRWNHRHWGFTSG